MSCAAHRIVTISNSLVGPIGVIALRPILADLVRRLVVSLTVQKSGRLKDMFHPWRAQNDEEQEKLQAILDELYKEFIRAMA